jgi:hypothetical protein
VIPALELQRVLRLTDEPVGTAADADRQGVGADLVRKEMGRQDRNVGKRHAQIRPRHRELELHAVLRHQLDAIDQRERAGHVERAARRADPRQRRDDVFRAEGHVVVPARILGELEAPLEAVFRDLVAGDQIRYHVAARIDRVQ